MTGHLELLGRLADHEDVPPALLIGMAILVFIHLARTVLAMLTTDSPPGSPRGTRDPQGLRGPPHARRARGRAGGTADVAALLAPRLVA